MSVFVRRFFSAEGGATAIEYALIILLIVLPIIAGVTAIGAKVASPFNVLSNNV